MRLGNLRVSQLDFNVVFIGAILFVVTIIAVGSFESRLANS